MLTKTDLQAIKKLLRQEIEAEGKNIRRDNRSELTSARMRIQEDVRDVSSRMKDLEIRMIAIEKKQSLMQKDMMTEFKKVRKEIEKSVDFLDRDYLNVKKRVEKMEKHLGLAVPA